MSNDGKGMVKGMENNENIRASVSYHIFFHLIDGIIPMYSTYIRVSRR